MTRISDQRKMEIMAAFQRSVKRDSREEIEAIGLDEVRQADEMLGNRDVDTGWRRAMQNRIKVLEAEEVRTEQREHESKIRAGTMVMRIVIGLVVVGLAGWLFLR